MPAATITLKVPVERKKTLLACAKREKKSLNAYILERIDGPRPPLASVIDRHAGVVRSGKGDLSLREGLGA